MTPTITKEIEALVRNVAALAPEYCWCYSFVPLGTRVRKHSLTCVFCVAKNLVAEMDGEAKK